jgi:aldose 1-epimerase
MVWGLSMPGPLIEIATSQARIGVRPDLGGSLAYFDMRRADQWLPILRPMPPASTVPTDAALIVLAPWSNRISGGGFQQAGRFHALSPNMPGEPCPIHGNAFQSAWQIDEQRGNAIALSLRSQGPGPYDYEARLCYRLTGSALAIELSLTHRGAYSLPYGAGFHPWFPRDATTRLTAPADGVWLEGPDHLPTSHRSIADIPAWNFATAKPLPVDWINNGFTGWSGKACIDWPDRQLSCAIAATGALPCYLLYSPGAAADFFCFEPVSHPVDAHHLPADQHLRILSAGETLEIGLALTPTVIGRPPHCQ